MTFRYDDVEPWIEYFAASTSEAALLAARYVAQVEQLVDDWKIRLQQTATPPRADAAAWSLIEMLPACPTISGPVAVARLNRSRGKTYEAIQTLEDAGILVPLTKGKRNQAWEPAGLLDLIAQMEG
jgi:hypothetical protein